MRMDNRRQRITRPPQNLHTTIGIEKKTEGGLIGEFEQIFRQAEGAFSQKKIFERARTIALSILVGLGRRTVTGIISTSGRQFHDWSADYRLFSRERFDPDGLFGAIRRSVLELLPDNAPIIAAMDDTLKKKRGTKIPGVSYRRDPLGPRFRPNFITAQRFIQISLALPEAEQPCGVRMIPVDFRHAPTPRKPGKDAPESIWREYSEAKKKMNLSVRGVERIQALRKALDDDPGGAERDLHIVVDGSYTNGTVFKNLPENTTLIGRVRKDSKLYYLPEGDGKSARGRKRVYGKRAPTPEELRKDESVKWQTVEAQAAGKVHEFEIKTMAPLRSRVAGEKFNLRMIVIRPLAYRPRKGSPLLYRKPGYLICTDPDIPLQQILQTYLWRWDIEVNFRDEKQLVGVGEAQVRTQSSAELLPAFCVAAYAILLLAACKTYGVNGVVNGLPPPKWRKHQKKKRPSTQYLINQLRAELWGKSMGIDNFSGFAPDNTDDTKPEKCFPHLPSALLYTVA